MKTPERSLKDDEQQHTPLKIHDTLGDQSAGESNTLVKQLIPTLTGQNSLKHQQFNGIRVAKPKKMSYRLTHERFIDSNNLSLRSNSAVDSEQQNDLRSSNQLQSQYDFEIQAEHRRIPAVNCDIQQV